jgi:asparagine synthase (glutamine-hydrolysing)
MCGITGWVAFDHDVTRQRDVLEAMTDTMAPRGPDAAGLWLDGPAALGHRRLAVIDIAGGVQPMRIERDGRDALVITYSGEVYNYRELRSELVGLGHVFRTGSDTEVVLHAYLEWGDEFVHRLNGMYAFALWEPEREELLLVRDRLGIKPLYYYPTRDGVIFGSEPKAVLAHPGAEPVVNAEGLAELLAFFVNTPGHAGYSGMRELRPGHTCRVTRRGLTTRRYWALEAREHEDDLPTTIRHIRELLDDIVSRQLVADVPLCTLLSGGLDSSVITALAAGHGPVRSFAVDFGGQSQNFAANALYSTPDTPYARTMAEHIHAAHTEVVLETGQLIDPKNADRVLRARDLPNGLGEGDTSLFLLFQAIREHSTVALSGEAADEVFGGYPWFHREALVRADTFPWMAAIAGGYSPQQAANSRLAFLSPDLRAEIDVAEYVDARYREAIAEVPVLPGEDPVERRMREISHLHLTRFVLGHLDRKDRASMAVGLEVRVPFCDHRLVEYVFNTPWAMKSFDGREKSLLRAATRDLLPPVIADRVKSPYPSTQDPGYAEAVRGRLRELLATKDAPVLPYLDRAVIRDALDDAAGPEVRNAGEIVLMLDTWMRQNDVRLELTSGTAA